MQRIEVVLQFRVWMVSGCPMDAKSSQPSPIVIVQYRGPESFLREHAKCSKIKAITEKKKKTTIHPKCHPVQGSALSERRDEKE